MHWPPEQVHIGPPPVLVQGGPPPQVQLPPVQASEVLALHALPAPQRQDPVLQESARAPQSLQLPPQKWIVLHVWQAAPSQNLPPGQARLRHGGLAHAQLGQQMVAAGDGDGTAVPVPAATVHVGAVPLPAPVQLKDAIATLGCASHKLGLVHRSCAS
jgi:hypothetical protein